MQNEHPFSNEEMRLAELDRLERAFTPNTRKQKLTQRTGTHFLDALRALPEFKPRPGVDLGRLRITVSIPDDSLDLGSVDIDPVNLGDLAGITARRAEGLRAKHARLASRPNLRLLGGGR